MTSLLHMRERGEAVSNKQGIVQAEVNQQELKKLIKTLKKTPKECRSGITNAINRSLTQVNKSAKKAVIKRYTIGEEAASGKTFFPVRAKQSNLNARIVVRGTRYSLTTKHSGLISPEQPVSHKGMTMGQIKRIPYPRVHVENGGSAVFKRGFIARGNNTVGIFSRGKSKKSKGKTVLEMHSTLSAANMVKNEEVKANYQNVAQTQLSVQVPKEIKKKLEKLAK